MDSPGCQPQLDLDELIELKSRVRELEQALALSQQREKSLVESEAHLRNLVESLTYQIRNERLRYEVHVQEGEAWFRALVETSFEGIILHDGRQIIQSNQEAARIFGYSSEALRGKDLLEVTAPEFHDLIKANILNETDKPYSVVGRKQDGSYFELELRGRTLPYQGQLLRMKLLRDVTERNKAKRELEHERDFALQVMNTMGQGLTVINQEGRFMFVNEAYARMLGYKAEDLTGRTPYEVTYPEDHNTLHEARMKRKDGQGTSYETRLQGVDGGIVEVYITGVPYWRDGEVVGAIAVITDITERKKMERALRESEQHFSRIFHSAPMPISLARLSDGACIDVNPKFTEATGFGREEALGRAAVELVGLSPATEEEVTRHLLSQGRVNNLEVTILNKQGEAREVLTSIEAIEMGGEECLLSTFYDITEHKQMEKQLRESEERYRVVVSALEEGVVLQERDNGIVTANESAVQLLGLSEDQLRGRNSLDPRWQALYEDGSLFPGEKHPAMVCLETGKAQSKVVMGIHKPDSSLTWLSVSARPLFREGVEKPYGVVVSLFDITERKRQQDDLTRQVFYDSLTGLPNRILFKERLEQSLTLARRTRGKVGVAFLDLDGFKAVNDNLGHSAGDWLLQEVARRLQGCIRVDDTVARMSGDEFTLILSNLETEHEALSIGKRIVAILAAPYEFEGKVIEISASVGMSLYPGDSIESTGLVEKADSAMYRAKSQGKNSFCLFTISS